MLLTLPVVMILVAVMTPKADSQVWDFKGSHLDPIPKLGISPIFPQSSHPV